MRLEYISYFFSFLEQKRGSNIHEEMSLGSVGDFG